MASSLQVTAIAKHYKVSESSLDREIASDEFYEISAYLTKWKLLAPRLRFSPTEIEDIEGNNRKAEDQRIGFLEKWQQKMAHKATYQALMEALLGINRADDARAKCTVPRHQPLLHTTQSDSSEGARTVEMPTLAAEKEYFCGEHHKKRVELYCQTCNKLICYRCVAKWGSHHDHNYEDLKEAAEQHRQEMAASLEPMKKCHTQNKEAQTRLKGRCEELTDQKNAVEAYLLQVFKKFHETLHTCKTELISQLHQLTREKLERLAVQLDQLETMQARLSSCLTDMKEGLQTETDEEVLINKTKLAEQVERLLSTAPPDQLEPMTTVTFSHHNINLPAYCKKYLQISETGLPQSLGDEDGLTGPSEERAGAEAGGVRRGVAEPEAGAQGGSEAELASPGTGPKQTWAIGTSSQTAASTPWDVAINQRRGEVVVTKYGEEHISVFSPQGRQLRSFGKPGSGRGEFHFPSAVEVDGEGNILVTDYYNHRIQHFTPKGKFIRAASSRDDGPLQLKYPSGIAFNRRNNKVYVTNSQKVLVLNYDLTLNSRFSLCGSGEGYRPCGIACDSFGKVYVPDYEGHCIQVYTAEGTLLKTFGEFGRKQGQLNSPSHVAIDSQNNVYVSEKNHRVSVFNPIHVFVTSFSNKSEELLCPRGVAVDSEGKAYVCDWVNNRVHIF